MGRGYYREYCPKCKDDTPHFPKWANSPTRVECRICGLRHKGPT